MRPVHFRVIALRRNPNPDLGVAVLEAVMAFAGFRAFAPEVAAGPIRALPRCRHAGEHLGDGGFDRRVEFLPGAVGHRAPRLCSAYAGRGLIWTNKVFGARLK